VLSTDIRLVSTDNWQLSTDKRLMSIDESLECVAATPASTDKGAGFHRVTLPTTNPTPTAPTKRTSDGSLMRGFSSSAM
jgi:hypothetical protein